MVNRAKRLLVIDANNDIRTQIVEAVSSAHDFKAYEFVECRSLHDALDKIEAAAPDVIIVGGVGERESILKAVDKLHQNYPLVPILAVVDHADRTMLGAAFRLGAHECLDPRRALEPKIVSVLRDTIDRAQVENATPDSHDSQHDEIIALQALMDPARLHHATRYYGVAPMLDSEPQEFRSLVLAYVRLIDLSLEQQCVKGFSELGSDFNGLVQKLAALNAGPRDVIDIHKAALASKLKGLAPRKSKACIEESRLLLLKVMGELVRYYRTLSWGNIFDKKHEPLANNDAETSESTRRDR